MSIGNKIEKVEEIIREKSVQSISFDIDGTVYPMIKVKVRWWQLFFLHPLKASRFLKIRKTWEKRRAGEEGIVVSEDDVRFFGEFLLSLLHSDLVPSEMRQWIKSLKQRGIQVMFLTDHGAEAKLKALSIANLGECINCYLEAGELKPHTKITELFLKRFHINPAQHLHLGDRWTDREQARLLGCEFLHFEL